MPGRECGGAQGLLSPPPRALQHDAEAWSPQEPDHLPGAAGADARTVQRARQGRPRALGPGQLGARVPRPRLLTSRQRSPRPVPLSAAGGLGLAGGSKSGVSDHRLSPDTLATAAPRELQEEPLALAPHASSRGPPSLNTLLEE